MQQPALAPRTPNTLDALELLLSENTKVTVDVSARKCEELLVELMNISIANVTNSQVPYKSFQRLGANTKPLFPEKAEKKQYGFPEKFAVFFENQSKIQLQILDKFETLKSFEKKLHHKPIFTKNREI